MQQVNGSKGKKQLRCEHLFGLSFGIVGSIEAAATGGSGWGSDAARASKLRPTDPCITSPPGVSSISSTVVDDAWSVPDADDAGETSLRLAMIRFASFSMSWLQIPSTSALLAASRTSLATKPYEHLPFLFAATFSMYRCAYPRINMSLIFLLASSNSRYGPRTLLVFRVLVFCFFLELNMMAILSFGDDYRRQQRGGGTESLFIVVQQSSLKFNYYVKILV